MARSCICKASMINKICDRVDFYSIKYSFNQSPTNHLSSKIMESEVHKSIKAWNLSAVVVWGVIYSRNIYWIYYGKEKEILVLIPSASRYTILLLSIIMPIEASESYESLHLHLEVISDVETVESSLGPKPFRCFRFFRLQKLFCWRIICCCSSMTKDGKISQKMSRKEDLMEDFG